MYAYPVIQVDPMCDYFSSDFQLLLKKNYHLVTVYYLGQ